MYGSKRQKGGVYGLMFTFSVLGIVTMVGFKVTPIYLNQMKVTSAVNQICESPQYSGATVYEIRKDLQKRWDIEDVQHLQIKDIKVLKVANGRALSYKYEVRTNLISNWDLVLTFADKKNITGRGAE